MAVSLVARGLGYAYGPGAVALRDVSLEVESGRVTFILGANGSGKTTLLQCLCGVRRPGTGTVTLRGVPVTRMTPRQRAHALAYVPQVHEPVFAYSVFEVVLMGRTPHRGTLAAPRPADRDATLAALDAVGLAGLRDRAYTRTSGGEQRLVLIARGLAQGAPILLLDEPDAHLDPSFQERVLRRIGGLTDGGRAAVVTSHAPNNALIHGDQVVFLARGEHIASGPPCSVLTEETLQAAYGMPFVVIEDAAGRRAILPAQPAIDTPELVLSLAQESSGDADSGPGEQEDDEEPQAGRLKIG
jgi:iron complex transport system ATP-binding protein